MKTKIIYEIAKHYTMDNNNSIRIVYDDIMEFNRAADRLHPATEYGDLIYIDHISRAITFTIARMRPPNTRRVE